MYNYNHELSVIGNLVVECFNPLKAGKASVRAGLKKQGVKKAVKDELENPWGGRGGGRPLSRKHVPSRIRNVKGSSQRIPYPKRPENLNDATPTISDPLRFSGGAHPPPQTLRIPPKKE